SQPPAPEPLPEEPAQAEEHKKSGDPFHADESRLSPLADLGDLAVHVPARVAGGDLAAPVVELLATPQAEFDLGVPSVTDVDAQWHEREAFGLCLARELRDLVAMQQQLPRP